MGAAGIDGVALTAKARISLALAWEETSGHRRSLRVSAGPKSLSLQAKARAAPASIGAALGVVTKCTQASPTPSATAPFPVEGLGTAY